LRVVVRENKTTEKISKTGFSWIKEALTKLKKLNSVA
jgi:hypothetical protein